MLDENHMGWKLVRGVRLDVINLFKSFSSTNSVRYEDFCKVWKNMNFSLIFREGHRLFFSLNERRLLLVYILLLSLQSIAFSGNEVICSGSKTIPTNRHRITFVELLEFTEELLQIVKEYLSSVYEFHTRIAALYTLYGLYFKQPIKGAAKIRYTKSEWEEMYLLMEECKRGGHYDIVFIHLKLLLNGAYTFAATARPVGLEQGFRKYFEKKYFSKICDVQLFYKPLISERLVRSLVQLESLYCEKKSEFLGKKDLIFIDGKFAQTLQEELKNYESSLQIQYSGKQKADIENSGKNSDESIQADSETIPRKLKNKSKTIKNCHLTAEEEIEQNSKKCKPHKKYQELLAKKKAEYYIQKLRQMSSQKSNPDEKFLDLELPDSDSAASDDT